MQSLSFRFAIVAAVSFGTLGMTRAAEHEVVGTDDNTWEYMGKASPEKASVGKPADRLKIAVKNGDILIFKVKSGAHGVIFEKATTEKKNGVWEVVKDPNSQGGELKTATLGKAYQKEAEMTKSVGMDKQIIKIKVKDLKKGEENGILFGCNPHSRSNSGKDVPMLGVIVLAD